MNGWKYWTINYLKSLRVLEFFVNEGHLDIKTSSNNYTLFIYNNRKVNKLRLSGILSGKEYEYLKSIEKSITIKDITIQIINGENRHYDSIWGTHETPLTASNISEIKQLEAQIIITSIVNFISIVEEVKDYCYINRKNL